MSTAIPTGLLLDGVFASEAIDSSGEILSIKGMDISTFDEGKGLANYEHKDSSGDSNGQEIVGKVVYVHKIFNEDDCLDDRQKLFWKRTKVPFLYGVVRLYDGAGHDGAKALAASIRDSVAHEEPIIVGFSIEGATLQRDGNKLKSTIGRLVALTTKPCNKQAVSGILADPNAPEGYSTNPENARTTLKNITDPLNMRLGGSETEYGAEMLKALTAGSYGGPPSTLTGGSALQREDKTLKSMAKAAARDWPKTGKFREFLKSYLTKAELGDVSDEFLDHYSDLVESRYYRVKKAEEVITSLKKAGKEVQWKPNVSEKTIAGLKQKHGYETPEQRQLVDGIVRKIHHSKAGTATATPLLTNNGQVVKPNKKLVDPTFDAGAGVLHMPQGSFKVYLPHQDTPELSKHFDDLLSSPKVEKFHGYAMQNWVKAHQLLKAGKLPPEVAMHAVLFSNLSPNTPVPMQELMYGHLVDSMAHTGLNPLSPNFEDMRSDWRGRDSATKLPDHSPQHWKRLLSSLRLKHDSKKSGRVEGNLGSFMLADDKFDNMSKYVEMHQPLQELLGRYKHNARGAAEEMMNHKQEQVRWENRRRLAAADGKPDLGKYPGMSISGLAPKTTRYALGMMGGGNVVVPDTHFVRNLFGLNREQDGGTIEAIKKVLWNHRSAPVLNGIDQFYANNHPAVKHMLQHPKWGQYFEKPEDAVFPAFWKHWMAIVPHERARGHVVRGYNELTDHRPFWEAVAPFTKSENTSLPEQTARQHAQWVTEYGEIPAGLLYAHHLLPRLLGAAASREAETTIRKAQELQIELLAKRDPVSAAHSAANSAAKVLKQIGTPNAQDQSTDTADYRDIPNRPIVFQGRQVKPGKAQFNNDNFHVLGTTATHLLGLPANKDPYKGWTDQDLVKLDRNDPDLNVYGYPESVDSPGVVNADIHGVMGFVDHPETRALAHGFNFDLKSDKQATGGVTVGSGDSYWGKSPTGQHVFVKGSSRSFNDSHEGSWNTARKEGIYHNIAKDFFGLGAHVPNVAVVRHPRTGQEHALISHVDGHTIHMLRPYDGPNRKGYPSILGAIGTPTLQKLGIMNSVMGNIDRHDGNYMVNEKGPDGKPSITLIDHNIFGENGKVTPRYLLHAGTTKEPLHPEVAEWLKTLDMDAFKHHLIKNGVPEASRGDGHFVPSRPILQPMLARLQYYKDHAHNDATFGYALHNAASAGQGDGVIQIPDTSSAPNKSPSDLDY